MLGTLRPLVGPLLGRLVAYLALRFGIQLDDAATEQLVVLILNVGASFSAIALIVQRLSDKKINPQNVASTRAETVGPSEIEQRAGIRNGNS